MRRLLESHRTRRPITPDIQRRVIPHDSVLATVPGATELDMSTFGQTLGTEIGLSGSPDSWFSEILEFGLLDLLNPEDLAMHDFIMSEWMSF